MPESKKRVFEAETVAVDSLKLLAEIPAQLTPNEHEQFMTMLKSSGMNQQTRKDVVERLITFFQK